MAVLVATGQQQHERVTVPAEVHAIAGTDMDAQFHHTFADGLAIAEISGLYATQALASPRLDDLVAHGVQPFGERLATVVALIAKEFEPGECCSL
ncbi:hypothetical protein WT36_21080 [Burkholderia territorii]|nr:hypothetical protein WT36_21080 [Burkholderia territorii]